MKTKLKTTNIHGKEYVEVHTRIQYFRENFKDWALTTEILELDDARCVMKASIFDKNDRLIATGTAYEKESSSFINKTSFIENCETSAWGRALGILGIGIDNSIGSADEVKNAIKNSNKIKMTKDIMDAMLSACRDGKGDIVEMRMKKYEMATKIERWLKKNKLTSMVRIYFNNKCWCWYEPLLDGGKKVIEPIKATDYFEYGNDDTISMSFEGPLYDVLNYGCDNERWDRLEIEFTSLINSYGYYFELGNAWNLALCKV